MFGRGFGAWALRWPCRSCSVIFGLIAYPLGYSVWLSLQDVKLGGQGTFVGLGNYYRLLFDTKARSTTPS